MRDALRAMAGIGVLVALAACGGPSTEPLVEALEELELPDDWTRVSEDVDEKGLKGDCNFVAGPDCPRVMWRYEAPEAAGLAYEQVIEAVQAQGYEITDGDTDECSGPLALTSRCRAWLTNGDVLVIVSVHQAEDDVAIIRLRTIYED